MATLSVKPSQRFRLPDWHTNSYLLSTNAERQRDASHQIRQEARVLRNETNNQTIWDEHDNRTRLEERVDTVNRWKEMLDKCLTDLDAEIDALTQMKESAEQNLQAKNLPLDVAIECLTLRDSRRDIDVVKDPVEEELHKEVEVIDATKKALQRKIGQSFEKLCLLQEVRQQLNSDHRGKMETLDIDRGCLSLNLKSPNISLKINPTRVPDGSSTLQQWDDFSQFSKNRAEAEMKEAVELREAIALTIAETNNELEAQRVATEFAFRKRLREMEKVYSELKWQEKNVSLLHLVSWGLDFLLWDEEPAVLLGSPGCTAVGSATGDQSLCLLQTLEEITELQKDIQHLEDDLRRKFLNLKLCHTRLESRTYRPNVELCRDQAQYGLTDEVHQLEAIIAALKQKLAQAQDALDALYKHLARLQADIACKANSMLLDTKCMDTRRKLTVPAEKFVPEVDTFTRTTNRTLSPLKSCQLELA
ncbi:tektin-2 isoform X1 [Pteropus vampyrus]|uniref:Tektin n=1 Tax=Pteropus vampyrus TaxID=132908 RepID=A0A6P6CCM9_PTEVA|nr:tektin-2 isoform X1 [Pteropus vampyrus]XP_023385136.1 tektin-2 isoform X1 [Pteropus vampyrus]XP_023385137.1 tektin-2 isoform X1 [Pteropus vampyrus]XP_023385138.1 tektin-2 isoform X1 [Pteropus vampyrus]